MLDVDCVLRQDRLMRASKGLTLPAFARLLVSFSMASAQAARLWNLYLESVVDPYG